MTNFDIIIILTPFKNVSLQKVLFIVCESSICKWKLIDKIEMNFMLPIKTKFKIQLSELNDYKIL